jgi:hypothetical protein
MTQPTLPGQKILALESGLAAFDGGGAQVAAMPWTVGTFVANGASAVTVADAKVTASSLILIGLRTVGGTVGAIPAVKTITPGTGFTVAGTASDTSTYVYVIIG